MPDFKDNKPRRPRKAGAESWDPRGPRPASDSQRPYEGKKTSKPGEKRSFDSVKAAAPGRGERPMFAKRPGAKPPPKADVKNALRSACDRSERRLRTPAAHGAGKPCILGWKSVLRLSSIS